MAKKIIETTTQKIFERAYYDRCIKRIHTRYLLRGERARSELKFVLEILKEELT